ncbi:hypothetical protein CDAR_432571 [Caerostris darwini]|uniref:Uncharacterized protein n=1 Tax=Caerostris darwini TaxID=1538125 RepID=A0AAV4U303_9ARAC|nr:hypothetical protein CDAR_432571 [Caerostris darwini]
MLDSNPRGADPWGGHPWISKKPSSSLATSDIHQFFLLLGSYISYDVLCRKTKRELFLYCFGTMSKTSKGKRISFFLTPFFTLFTSLYVKKKGNEMERMDSSHPPYLWHPQFA